MSELKITLDGRKFVPIEVGEQDGEKVFINFYAETEAQKKYRLAPFNKKDEEAQKISIAEYEIIRDEHYRERIQGEEEVLTKLFNHFDKNGGFNDFVKECEITLGKQKKSV